MMSSSSGYRTAAEEPSSQESENKGMGGIERAVDVQIVKVSADLSHPVFSRTLSDSPKQSTMSLAEPSSSSSPAKPSIPPENLLHPPSSFPRKQPHRRNTTGSTTPRPANLSPSSGPTRSRISLHHSQFASTPGYGGDDELMSDISVHAEIIRKERAERRQQQEKEREREREMEKEKELDRDRPRHASLKSEHKVLVGNLIGEGHVNYVLMYNMLTGIRTSVSRCGAKIKRSLTSQDFSASHKYSFDIIGNELTPSAKYDFKFKDYAPWVFRELREDYFLLDPADYLVSLTGQYILSELGSPGKSGSFFYFSKDYRFIIKTIHPAEHQFLLKVLPQYHAHIKSNPHTLISRFYGLHRVKLPRGRKIHFVIMNNLFPPHKDIHETFDLKGSTVGRLYPWDKAKEKGSGAVLKDLNWIELGKRIELGPEKRALLTEQLRRDKEFLKEIHVMDYSLLIGIHNMRRGNKDKLRKNTLKVFSPELPRTVRRSTPGGSGGGGVNNPPSMAPSTASQPGAPSTSTSPPSATSAPIAAPVFTSEPTDMEPVTPSSAPGAASPDAHTVRKAIQQAATSSNPPQRLGKRTVRLPKGMSMDSQPPPPPSQSLSQSEEATSSSPPPPPLGESGIVERLNYGGGGGGGTGADARTHFLFYQDEGGLRGTDEANEGMDVVYYLGVIDILTPWTLKKRGEGVYKGIRADRHKISPIPPDQYAERFFAFLKAVMRGGEGGERFV